MAQQLFFSRDTKVYVKIGASDIWEIPVLDGFSWAQSTNSSEIVLAEMESASGVSRRGKRMFNDSLAPAEWSFTTYSRPFLSSAALGTKAHAVEEVLWALAAGPAVYEDYGFQSEAGTAGTPYFNWTTDTVADDTLTIDWDQSNKAELGTASIIFRIGDGSVAYKYYEVTSAIVNEATIDFDIDGIASINWSGMGSLVQETAAPTVTVNEALLSTTNFIRNRLTQLTVVPDQSNYNTDELEAAYNITLTGGSISFTNNITYITPEEIGLVNIPIGHVTGARSVSGSFTCYLVDDDGTASDFESGDFWSDVSALSSVVTHKFALTFTVGGTAGDPRMTFTMPTATIEIPTHSIEDVIALETNFSALPSTIDQTDEMTVGYYSTIAP